MKEQTYLNVLTQKKNKSQNIMIMEQQKKKHCEFPENSMQSRQEKKTGSHLLVLLISHLPIPIRSLCNGHTTGAYISRKTHNMCNSVEFMVFFSLDFSNTIKLPKTDECALTHSQSIKIDPHQIKFQQIILKCNHLNKVRKP